MTPDGFCGLPRIGTCDARAARRTFCRECLDSPGKGPGATQTALPETKPVSADVPVGSGESSSQNVRRDASGAILDQPAPTPDPRSRPVTSALRALLDERERRGIATYGTTLHTHNGRSSPRDLVEELIDGAQYALQWEMERADLLDEVDNCNEERGILTVKLSKATEDLEACKSELFRTRDYLASSKMERSDLMADVERLKRRLAEVARLEPTR